MMHLAAAFSLVNRTSGGAVGVCEHATPVPIASAAIMGTSNNDDFFVRSIAGAAGR
jgi:hypothetical protein